MAEAPPIDAFVAGGYFLVQSFVPAQDRHPSFFPPDLVPFPIVTLSPCLAEILPSEWAFGRWLPFPTREERESGAAEWGMQPDVIADLVTWASQSAENGRILNHDAFADVETAREFARRFLPPRADVRLLGVGLHGDLQPGFLRAVEAEGATVFGEHWGAPNGVLEGVGRLLSLAAGGHELGYEVLDVALGEPRHSWLCHGLERKMHDELGVRLGQGGLIPLYEQACRVAAYCDDPARGCERGVWRAWRVVAYDLVG